MPKLSLTIALEGAAMADNAGGESARILRDLADKIQDGSFFSRAARGCVWHVKDVNGNTIGTWKVSRR